jgi:hypothetical protein
MMDHNSITTSNEDILTLIEESDILTIGEEDDILTLIEDSDILTISEADDIVSVGTESKGAKPQPPQNVELSSTGVTWNASPSTNVVEYRVYFGDSIPQYLAEILEDDEPFLAGNPDGFSTAGVIAVSEDGVFSDFAIAVIPDFLLLQDGDFLLLQNGDKLILS